jgi:hypothetical protein
MLPPFPHLWVDWDPLVLTISPISTSRLMFTYMNPVYWLWKMLIRWWPTILSKRTNSSHLKSLNINKQDIWRWKSRLFSYQMPSNVEYSRIQNCLSFTLWSSSSDVSLFSLHSFIFSEWMSVYCLTTHEQFISYVMELRWDMWYGCFVLDQHA